MDEIRKSAILLLSLDKPLAAEILSQLPRSFVESVTFEIAKLDDVTKEEQKFVIEEFYNMAGERTSIERGGLDFANDLLEQSLGADGAGEILENVRQSMSSVPFGFLQKTNADNLLTFIQDEHPQTIALVMSHISTSLSAEVLSGLSPDKQVEVVQRIATMEQTSPEVIEVVEKSLESKLTSTFSQHLEKAGGIPKVAQILNVCDRMTNKGILEQLEEEQEELADDIKRLMFVFDDLLKLDDKAIQSLLKEVDNAQWAVALKGANEEIKTKVLGNLSQRAADMLREEMEYLGPIKISEVEAMQSVVVDVVRQLEDSGEIEISSGESEQFIS
jgi:flagellar motor switch protein FliG